VKYLVDECFREEVERLSWHIQHGYLNHAKRVNGRVVHELMHRMVWRLSGRQLPIFPLQIDHINRNTLDNRLENLRLANPRLQGLNSQKPNKRNLPQGVTLNPRCINKPYQARIQNTGGKRKSLGNFATPEEASAAYEKKKAELIAIECSFTPC